MATELIANPTNTNLVIPNGMSVGFFDWSPIAGIPFWLYVTIFCIFIFILVNVYWMMRMRKLASVRGWAESLKKMSQEDVQVWFISRVQKLTIECLTIKDNILSPHDQTNIGMWHVNSPMGIIQVGGNKAVVCSEDFDQNRDFVTEIALCHACDDFNANQEQLKDDLEKKYQQALAINNELERPKVIKPIEDCAAYETYGRQCLQVINPDGIQIPPYNIYNPNKFRKYFPRGCSGMFFGGELIHDARKLNLRRKPKGFWEVHAFLMMAGGIAMIALLVAWLFPIGTGA
jgi:hypothetical protein